MYLFFFSFSLGVAHYNCGGFSHAHSAHCPLWGVKPARICPRPRVWEDFECSPTSVREVPHACLISPQSKAWCTTRPHLNVGDFPAHTQLIVRFKELSPHGFVLVPECRKTLSAVLHRLEKRPTHAPTIILRSQVFYFYFLFFKKI